MPQENTFEPRSAEAVDLREKPYVNKQGKTVNGLALVIGDQKIDYFGRFGGWDKWQALGELFTACAEKPELAKALGASIQKAYIGYLATTNGTRDAKGLGASLLTQ